MLLDVNDAVGGAKHPALILCWLTAIALLPFPLLTLAHTENQLSVIEGSGLMNQAFVLVVVTIESMYF